MGSSPFFYCALAKQGSLANQDMSSFVAQSSPASIAKHSTLAASHQETQGMHRKRSAHRDFNFQIWHIGCPDLLAYLYKHRQAGVFWQGLRNGIDSALRSG